jgi:hypothetical protein
LGEITRVKLPHDLRFTFSGFSAKRMAYLLVAISALLVPLHWHADYRGDEYLSSAGSALEINT